MRPTYCCEASVDGRARRVLDGRTKFSEELKCLRSSLDTLRLI